MSAHAFKPKCGAENAGGLLLIAPIVALVVVVVSVHTASPAPSPSTSPAAAATTAPASDARSLLLHAIGSVHAHDYKTAVFALDEVLTADPDNVEALTWRGIAKNGLGDFRGAINDYDRIVALHAATGLTYAFRCEAKSHLLGDYQSALADCNTAAQLDPTTFSRLARARVLVSMGLYKQAMNDYAKILDVEPNNVEALAGRCDYKRRETDLSSAVEDCDRAVALGPTSPLAHYVRALLRYDEGDLTGAAIDINSAMAESPRNVVILLVGCSFLSADGVRDYEGATRACESAFQIDPNNPLVARQRGLLFTSTQKYQDAADEFTRALQLRPSDAIVYAFRCRSKIELHDYAGAAADCESAVRLAPNSPYGYGNRVALDSVLRDRQRELADAEQTVRLAPTESDSYINRCAAKEDLHRFTEAISDCDRAVALNPGNPSAKVNRADLLIVMGRYAAALADIEAVSKVDPQNPYVFGNRCRVRQFIDQYESAGPDCERAIALEAGNGSWYVYRGGLKRHAGDYQGAFADYQTALKVDPANGDAILQRAITKQMVGDLPGALADFDLYLKLEPDDGEGYFGRAEVRQKQGDGPGALADYQHALALFTAQQLKDRASAANDALQALEGGKLPAGARKG
jgi:tetratricopeptide (TPR) repeat protein